MSKGVQVINHSCVSNDEMLLYDNAVKWIEHIINQHNVSFVQAAGNEGGNVGKPGLAYNVITVGGYNNSTAANAQIVWKRKDVATDIELAMCWYLEPVCYQVGDVDMDGNISAFDSKIVLEYSSGAGTLGSDTYVNILTYLADANSDGVVNAIDARLILRFSAGLE